MKKRLLLSLCLGMFSVGLFAQAEVQVLEDLTSKLTNADFSADAPVTTSIVTYDYNMPDDGVGAGGEGLFGQQQITGWTATTPSDNIRVMQTSSDPAREDGANARAAGIFALQEQDVETAPGLGGIEYPAPNAVEAASAGVTGPVLGMVAVWGADFRYTQPVTLPAGDYMMVVTYYNVGVGTTITTNNNGFTTDAGTAYMSARKDFPVNVWEQDTVTFRLTAETAGLISIGLKGDGGSGSAAHLFFDNVKLYSIAPSYIDQLEIDKAKATLLALIQEGENYGVDVLESQNVYDNPNATMEEVQAAIENQKALNEAGIIDLSEFFIDNPKFSQGEAVEGGICTYDYDCEKNNIAATNYSMLNVPGWTQSKTDNGAAAGVYAVGSDAFLGGVNYKVPTAMSDGNTEGNLLGVVTCWTMAAQYKQMKTLPAGRYSIVISYYNAGGANAVDKNLNGFVAEDGTEHLGQIKQYPVGSWATETIEFELDDETDGYFSLGYKSTNTGSGNMPHLFVDGFSLYYIGTGIDPSYLALNSAVNQGYKMLEEVFNADLKSQLEEVVSAGSDLVDAKSEDAEANKAATSAITALTNAVKSSIASYADLNVFREKLEEATEKYNQEDYPNLNIRLGELLDESNDAYEDGTWTDEEIASAIASYDVIVKEEIQKAWSAAVETGEKLPNDLDITVLFDQMAYTYSPTAVSNTNVPDKEWSYGSATNFKTQFGTAEVWNQSPFKVSRTLEGLPAGKYTITTKAFFRNADNATNLAEYDEANTPEAYLFAGSMKKGLSNVATLVSTEEMAGWVAVDGMYLPNNQEVAMNIFNDDAYTDLVETSVSTVVVSDGTLTFGIGADEMRENSWVVWYSFSIAYNAPDHDALLDVLAALDNEAENLKLDENYKVLQADDKINEAQTAYGNVHNMSDEEIKNLITLYEQAIAYTEQSFDLVKQLDAAYTLYNDYLMAQVESDEPAYIELMSNIAAAKSDGYESNEQVQNFINALKDGWTAFVQYPVLETSSETEPGNITPAIFNASFTHPVDNVDSAEGWTREFTGGKEDKSDGVWEFYNNEKFSISQTIKGLAEGYYRVRVQSFYRGATNTQALADSLALDADYARYVEFFGQTESTNKWTVLKNPFQREDEAGVLLSDPVGIDGEIAVPYGDVEEFYVANSRASFNGYAQAGLYWNQIDVFVGQGETLTIGLRKERFVANDWCPFDNFELYYLGTTAPTGIEAVEQGATARTAAPAAIYNLAGQRVQKAVKGLYIIDGKKVMVK